LIFDFVVGKMQEKGFLNEVNMSLQDDRNLKAFVEVLKTTLSDVDSFRKGEIESYFLLLRKFFKNYIKENNEKYNVGNPLYIHGSEAENINKFMNRMMDLFIRSKCSSWLDEMEVFDRSTLNEIDVNANERLNKLIDIQNILRAELLDLRASNERLKSRLMD